MRVARDGSTLVYAVPDTGEPRNAKVLQAFAPLSTGLAILTTKDVSGSEMYRFDGQGRLVGQRQVSLGFLPTAMVATSSGKIILVGYRGLKRERPNVGAVLDDGDKVLRMFEFPETSVSDNEWGFGQMAGGDGVAYFVANSPTGPLYKISESGHIDTIPVTPVNGTQHHKWLFGNRVVAEEYDFPDEKAPRAVWFDAYDLNSGNKVGTRSLARPMGYRTACFLGDEVSVMAHSGPGSEALRIITVSLR
jgi:hypothetical protein